MPNNIQYLVSAYGIAVVVIVVYSLRVFIGLKKIRTKLRTLQAKD